MTDVPKPEISPAFTLEDIRKIRDWNHERRKVMTPQEFRECRRRNAERVLALLEKPSDPAVAAEVQRRLDSVRKHKKAS